MARASADTGLVLAVSGTQVTVGLDLGGSETLQKMRHVSCSVGDLAHITTVGRARFVDGVIGASAAPAPEPAITVPPPDPEEISTGAWPFGPINPGSWRDGLWRSDTALLWQGAYGLGRPQYGAAWYGEGPSSLPGVLTDATLVLCRVEGAYGLVAPSIVLYAGSAQPTDEPIVLDSQPGPALDLDEPVTWDVPDDWLPLLADGTAGGLGCYLPGPEPALALTAEGSGMALTCRWKDDS